MQCFEIEEEDSAAYYCPSEKRHEQNDEDAGEGTGLEESEKLTFEVEPKEECGEEEIEEVEE